MDSVFPSDNVLIANINKRSKYKYCIRAGLERKPSLMYYKKISFVCQRHRHTKVGSIGIHYARTVLPFILFSRHKPPSFNEKLTLILFPLMSPIIKHTSQHNSQRISANYSHRNRKRFGCIVRHILVVNNFAPSNDERAHRTQQT